MRGCGVNCSRQWMRPGYEYSGEQVRESRVSIPDTPYIRIDGIVRRYVDGFNWDEYTPSETEQAMIVDAIHGLICQEDFMETILLARAMTHEARKAEGQRPCCGAGLNHPHYGLCVNAASQGEKDHG